MNGILKNGEEAGSAFGLATLKGCEDVYFEEPKVGATSTKCSIALAENAGSQVVGAAYEGSSDLYPDSSDNPYIKDPVIWLP